LAREQHTRVQILICASKLASFEYVGDKILSPNFLKNTKSDEHFCFREYFTTGITCWDSRLSYLPKKLRQKGTWVSIPIDPALSGRKIKTCLGLLGIMAKSKAFQGATEYYFDNI
jgi:hypothetical protein